MALQHELGLLPERRARNDRDDRLGFGAARKSLTHISAGTPTSETAANLGRIAG